MSLNFRVSQSGNTIKNIIANVKLATLDFITEIMMLGKESHQYMIDFIKANTKTSVENLRNSTPLVEAIDFVSLSDSLGIGWGIGTIAKLEEDSYHFMLIDQGGKHPNAGGFVPGEFTSTGVFVYAPYSGTGIIIGVNAVIAPMHYVSNTVSFVEKRIQQIVRKYQGAVK